MAFSANDFQPINDAVEGLNSIVGILKRKNLQALLSKLDDEPQSRALAEADAKGFLKSNGVSLPANYTASFVDNNWSVKVCSRSGWCCTVSRTRGKTTVTVSSPQ
jgi:hypothetical protein